MNWLRALLGGQPRSAIPVAAPEERPVAPPVEPPVARPVEPSVAPATAAEVDYVRETLAAFERAGLVRNPKFNLPLDRYTALIVDGYAEQEEVADPSPNRIIRFAPYPALTTLLQRVDEEDRDIEQYFANLRVFTDHCYDGATEREHEHLLGQVLALAEDDWTVERFSVRGPDHAENLGYSLTSGEGTHRFVLRPSKDIDARLFAHLNRAAPSAKGQFGIAGDGGVLLVAWLPPDRAEAVDSLLGLELHRPVASH